MAASITVHLQTPTASTFLTDLDETHCIKFHIKHSNHQGCRPLKVFYPYIWHDATYRKIVGIQWTFWLGHVLTESFCVPLFYSLLPGKGNHKCRYHVTLIFGQHGFRRFWHTRRGEKFHCLTTRRLSFVLILHWRTSMSFATQFPSTICYKTHRKTVHMTSKITLRIWKFLKVVHIFTHKPPIPESEGPNYRVILRPDGY